MRLVNFNWAPQCRRPSIPLTLWDEEQLCPRLDWRLLVVEALVLAVVPAMLRELSVTRPGIWVPRVEALIG
jgi:hypothetical protein